jgi:hypothetical protein
VDGERVRGLPVEVTGLLEFAGRARKSTFSRNRLQLISAQLDVNRISFLADANTVDLDAVWAQRTAQLDNASWWIGGVEYPDTIA